MGNGLKWLGPLLFMVGAGAVGAVKYTDIATGSDPETAVAKAVKAPAADAVRQDLVYLQMPALVVPMIRNGRTEKLVSFLILIGIDEEDDKKMRTLMPHLSNAFLKDLNSILAFDRLAGNNINLPSIKRRLTLTAGRVLEPGLVDDIRFKLVTERVPF